MLSCFRMICRALGRLQISVFGRVLSLSFRFGVFWFRSPSGVCILRAPWNEPLFSERYGYWKHRSFAGWRWGRK